MHQQCHNFIDKFVLRFPKIFSNFTLSLSTPKNLIHVSEISTAPHQGAFQEIRDAGLYKNERIIASPQAAGIKVENTPGEVLNFCANNYLGLSDNTRLIEAAKAAMDNRGYGMSLSEIYLWHARPPQGS